MTKTCLLSPLALTVAVLATGCGSDKSDNGNRTGTTQSQTTTQTQQPQQTKAPKVVRVKPPAGEADLGRRPRPQKGTGSPPSTLVAQDLIVGKGRKAAAGDLVSVQYVGVLFDSGKEFDASWKGTRRPGRPFPFALGSGQVIPGWDQGVPGMKVGGRRRLIIPSELAYGAQGYPPDIPANAALIFDVDLKKVGR